MESTFLPEYVTIILIIRAAAAAFLLSVLISIIISLFEASIGSIFRRTRENFFYLTFFSIPVSIIAVISGYLSAMSRSSAIGTVLPAMLSLIAAVLVYIFGVEHRQRGGVAYCACVFAVMLLYGTQIGGQNRDSNQEYRLTELIKMEAKIKVIRQNMGLSDDFPGWVIGAEPK